VSIEYWRDKYLADKKRWLEITQKEKKEPNGYANNVRKDTGNQYVLGEGDRKIPEAKTLSNGDKRGGGKRRRRSPSREERGQ
jgi:hypothetical protein